MICRMWKGFTTPANAPAYERYLREELFPRLQATIADQGYLGFHILRREVGAGAEVEFITMVWFTSLEAIKSFSGEGFERAVLTDKAKSLVAHWEEFATHHELVDSSLR
ncbi:MAG: antibiotic biosynthesis monooxygenase [Pseudomonadota bacterium]